MTATAWVLETVITGILALFAFFVSWKQYTLEKQQKAPKKLHLYFHRANVVTSFVIICWVIDLHGVFGIYPRAIYFFFGAFVSNWLWTQGIFYFYTTERALSHQERKKVSPWWKFVFVILIIVAWALGVFAVVIEFLQNVHHWWWIYSVYMAVACAILNIVGFHMLRSLRDELILLHKNLGTVNQDHFRKIQKLWIGNTVLLTLAVAGFGLTAYQHYEDRDLALSDVDVEDPNQWEFTRRLFFVFISLALLFYFMWITWLPLCLKGKQYDELYGSPTALEIGADSNVDPEVASSMRSMSSAQSPRAHTQSDTVKGPEPTPTPSATPSLASVSASGVSEIT